MQTLNCIHEYGTAVLGSKDLYYSWLHKPNEDFGGICPEELLYDTDGLQMVISLLYKIQSAKASIGSSLLNVY